MSRKNFYTIYKFYLNYAIILNIFPGFDCPVDKFVCLSLFFK